MSEHKWNVPTQISFPFESVLDRDSRFRPFALYKGGVVQILFRDCSYHAIPIILGSYTVKVLVDNFPELGQDWYVGIAIRYPLENLFSEEEIKAEPLFFDAFKRYVQKLERRGISILRLFSDENVTGYTPLLERIRNSKLRIQIE